MNRLVTPARVGVVLAVVALAAIAVWALAGRSPTSESKVVAATSTTRSVSAHATARAAAAPAAQSGACPACSAPAKSTAAVATAQRTTRARAKGAGVVVAIDPESGQLSAPTAEQAAALRALGASSAKAGPGIEVFHQADGSVIAVDRSGLFQQFSVVSIGADGKLHATCAQGPVQALDALHRPAPLPPPAAEEK